MEIVFVLPREWEFNRRSIELPATADLKPVLVLVSEAWLNRRYGMVTRGEDEGQRALQYFDTHRELIRSHASRITGEPAPLTLKLP